MIFTIAVLVLAAGLVAWLGQALVFFAPATGTRLGLVEPVEEVDPVLRTIESKAEAAMDVALGWTLPAAAVLLLLDHPWWPVLGLVGAGVYLYFGGLIILSRIYLKKQGRLVGSGASEKAAYAFGAVWALSGVVMLVLALATIAP